MDAQLCRWRANIAVIAVSLLIGASCAAHAQSDANYPNKPIRVIVPFVAGGGNDIFARLVGAKASEILGQQLIIENRPAAGGRVAAEYVVSQPADGYTLYIGASGNMSVAAAVYPDLAYSPLKNFIPLTMIADFPLVLIVPPKSSIKTVPDLVAFAKANPDKSTYGTTSPAFTLTTEILKMKTGMPGVASPLKGSSEMVQCVNQDLCLLAFPDPPPSVSQAQDGMVRAIAVTGDKRSSQLPDVPSMTELGYPEVNTKLWSGVLVAAGTPQPIVDKLVDAFQKAIRDKDVSARLVQLGANPGGNSPEEFRKLIASDIATYSAVVKAANLKFQ
ncbi:tripartite tricarboxylate transporter substrate binding protein [Roseiarcaceae bacterium H3SJ34-1]|uniref:Bug family tripartite tricarboxylate transporter substrate binding protein n=1 Tax=Terripilifer ovatus TaxID=3032367 RepID=UPI003AB9B8BF|nr:tripartite tricarboxylate transporter substrate binding protein [Roseiarcaceae bacterium H3SJ34-1]